MFRHRGNTRTIKHNLQIASLLSFVAGMVNVAGFLSVKRLTTNVTGHFAYFVDELFKLEFFESYIYFIYIFFFFLGSFISNVLVEMISKRNHKYEYIVPVIFESLILYGVSFFGNRLILENPNIIACSLLFAMGLQNSLVTSISNATVRTTHLTGLFTDLGIELSQLLFYRLKEEKAKLYSSIKLRFTIIGFFFTGGLMGGVIYNYIGIHVLYLASSLLLLGIVYDGIKLKIFIISRNYLK